MISIIIPIYNSSKYLSDCLQSILDNSYDDFEVILIDDGSKDNSIEICNNFLKDNRFSLYSRNHGGVSSARNFGLSIAKGEYVIFLDSDDMLLNDTLEYLYSIIEKYNPDYICASFEYVVNNKRLYEGWKDTFLNINEISSDYLNVFLSLNRILSKVFKLGIIRQNSLKFKENISYAEDTIFSLDYLEKCKNIYVSSKSTYLYRRQECSNTLSHLVGDYNEIYLYILYKYISILKNDDVFTDSIKISFTNQWFYMCVYNYFSKSNDKNFIKNEIEDLISKFIDNGFFETVSRNDTRFSFSKYECKLLNDKKYSRFVNRWFFLRKNCIIEIIKRLVR